MALFLVLLAVAAVWVRMAKGLFPKSARLASPRKNRISAPAKAPEAPQWELWKQVEGA